MTKSFQRWNAFLEQFFEEHPEHKEKKAAPKKRKPIVKVDESEEVFESDLNEE